MTKTTAWREGSLLLFFHNIDFELLGDPAGLLGSAVAGKVFLSLHTAAPGLAGNQKTSETSYTGYDPAARPGIVRSAVGWLQDDNLMTNLSQVTYPTNTGANVTITHMGAGCLISGTGKLCYTMQFSTPIEVLTQMAPRFDIREIGFAEV